MKPLCYKTKLIALLVTTAILFFCARVSANELPSPKEKYLNDYANVLTTAGYQDIRARLIDIEKTSGKEITVVIQDRKPSAWKDRGLEAYATALFNYWGVGNAERNDGVMLLILVQDRQSRIELGAAYGHEWDAQMKRLMDNKLIPLFREQQWAEAIHRALDGFAALNHARSPGLVNKLSSQKNSTLWIGFALMAVPVISLLLWLFKRFNRHRSRACRACHSTMIRLSEAIDDRYLSGPQRKEEKLKSVDYDVWKCTRCEGVQVIEYPAFFSAVERCPKCNGKTGKKTSKSTSYGANSGYTLHLGCAYCQHTWHRFIEQSADSDSGSSSSFGGGSSGGGGASGSW